MATKIDQVKMSLSEIDRESILRSIEEFDSLGRTELRRKFGYGQSQSAFLEVGGRRYDSNAICGVTVKYTSGSTLKTEDFSVVSQPFRRNWNRLDSP